MRKIGDFSGGSAVRRFGGSAALDKFFEFADCWRLFL